MLLCRSRGGRRVAPGSRLWRGPGWRAQSLLLITLWLTAAAMYVGLGTQRVGFGVENAAISRYQYMGAMLLAPAFALAVDQLRRISSEALWRRAHVLVAAIALNLGSLAHEQCRVGHQRRRRTPHLLELIAGSDLAAQADPNRQPIAVQPRCQRRDITMLVADGAIVPRTPATPEEVALVRAALGSTLTSIARGGSGRAPGRV